MAGTTQTEGSSDQSTDIREGSEPAQLGTETGGFMGHLPGDSNRRGLSKLPPNGGA